MNPTDLRRPLRLGLVGLDSSHVVAFAELLNGAMPMAGADGARITHAWPGGSSDVPASRDRVAGFTATLKETYHVEMLPSPEAVAAACDAVLITAVDGRTHPELYARIAPLGRPTFIDKPVATSCEGLTSIIHAAADVEGRWFSSSALRFLPAVVEMRERVRGGEAKAIEIAGPVYWEPTNPGYFWYGIHLVETLCAVRGAVARRVRVHEAASTQEWVEVEQVGGERDRLRVLPPGQSFCAYFGSGDQHLDPIRLDASLIDYLRPLLQAMLPFFRGMPAPVELAETSHVVRCIAAINQSRKTGTWVDV